MCFTSLTKDSTHRARQSERLLEHLNEVVVSKPTCGRRGADKAWRGVGGGWVAWNVVLFVRAELLPRLRPRFPDAHKCPRRDGLPRGRAAGGVTHDRRAREEPHHTVPRTTLAGAAAACVPAWSDTPVGSQTARGRVLAIPPHFSGQWRVSLPSHARARIWQQAGLCSAASSRRAASRGCLRH